MVVVTAEIGPKVFPMKVINEPVDGIERENSESVLPSRAIAIAARTIVSGEAMPAACTMRVVLKKKLIAGAILAMVAVAISTRFSAPCCRRGISIGIGVFPSMGMMGCDSSCVLMADPSFSEHFLY